MCNFLPKATTSKYDNHAIQVVNVGRSSEIGLGLISVCCSRFIFSIWQQPFTQFPSNFKLHAYLSSKSGENQSYYSASFVALKFAMYCFLSVVYVLFITSSVKIFVGGLETIVATSARSTIKVLTEALPLPVNDRLRVICGGSTLSMCLRILRYYRS